MVQLWRAALRLEDGDLADAAERLARAQERLKDAIENGASEDEIARLMQELPKAMQDYMAAMAQEMLRDQANGQQQQQPPSDGQTLTQNDLERMLQELEEAIRNGQQELARQMPGASLHGSLPCTAWSTWQNMAEHKFGQDYSAKLEERRKESRKMLKSFIELAEIIYENGGEVSFELDCLGWHLDELLQMIVKLNM